MMKKIWFLFILLTFSCFSFSVQAKELTKEKNIDLNKKWTIKFNKQVKRESINSNSVYILDSNEKRVELTYTFSNEDKWVILNSEKSFTPNATYTLNITEEVKGTSGEQLKENIIKKFTTKDGENQKYVVGWNYINNKSHNKYFYDDNDDYLRINSKIQGMNVVSPTWFNLKWQGDKVVGVTEKVDKDYLKYADQNDYRIWACFQESFLSSNGETLKEYGEKLDALFKDKEAVNLIINETVKYIKKYQIDGLNLDFEAMGEINRDNYTNFVREFSKVLKKEGIVFSVDVNKPVFRSPYSRCYDRSELAKHVDFIMLMAYDEYHGNGESGSVASYDWVETTILQLLNSGVPSEKLILGVPFYMKDYAVIEAEPKINSVIVTRRVIDGEGCKLYSKQSLESEIIKECTYGDLFKLILENDEWYEVEYNNEKGYIRKKYVQKLNGNEFKRISVGTDTVTMDGVKEILKDKEYNASKYFDEDSKQDVVVYYKYDRANTVKLKHMIWCENEKSMRWRIELAEKYKLRGIAAWRLGQESSDIWKGLKEYLDDSNELKH